MQIVQNSISELEIESALKKIFGFSSFRPNQENIVNAILGHKDVFAVMPTGGGKSLCYQLPAYLLEGTCVVISPLIALMKDQVDSARSIGIRAEYLNSSLSGMEMADVFNKLEHGDIDLLYVAPERFAMDNFLITLQRVPLCMFAIDEAHCISEWGHDFRPDYLSLSKIINEFPDVPVSAFTATATGRVQEDIVKRLGLRNPYGVRASFNRPNLFYQVDMKHDINFQILSFIHERPDEAGIVYRTTRQNVESTADFLLNNGIKALPYHAGLDNSIRKKHQEAFNRDEVDVIVATIAFGMGIDKSNVRYVVHGDLPKNMEGYYQETGRAGRDDEPAHCMLFFGRGDISKIRYFIDQVTDDHERSVASDKLNEIVNFASANVCRRKQILYYFEEELNEDNCGMCDVCSGDVERVDATIDSQVIMSAIMRTGQRFGTGHIIDVVRGANTEKIRSLGHNEIKTYGAGKDKDKLFWRGIINELIGQGCIVQTEDKFPVLAISNKGMDILKGEKTVLVLKQREAKKTVPVTDFKDFNQELFALLREVRKQLADDNDVPPFVIFSDKTLHEMCRIFPVNKSELLSIHGVGERKLKLYGELFLSVIELFISENPHLKDTSSIKKSLREKKIKSKKKKVNTLNETLTLLNQGLTYFEVAEKRELAPSTIAGHIEQLIQKEHDIDINLHINKDKRIEIEKLFKKTGTGSLRTVVDASDGSVSYEEARMVRAVLER